MEEDPLLTIDETANYLGISPASVRNWIKQGYLKKTGNSYDRNQVKTLLHKIRTGEIERLNRRANKRESHGTIGPSGHYSELCSKVNSLELSPAVSMWLISVSLFRLHTLTEDKPLKDLIKLDPADYRNDIARQVLSIRLQTLDISPSSPIFISASEQLETIDLPSVKPADTDIAGIIYQAVCRRGSRSKSGSFYTPSELSSELILSAVDKLKKPADKLSFIEPCCGSGQFILSFIEAGGLPENIVGIDYDETAAFITSVNILLQCRETKNLPAVFTANSLLQALPDGIPKAGSYDLCVTNPPWGAATVKTRNKLEKLFPEITSGESFSFFICKCVELVRVEGIISLVLPESITNVRRHRDIRDHILNNCRISKLKAHGKIFKPVFTSVVSMELFKTTVIEKSTKNSIDSFNINLNSEDAEIIDHIYSLPYTNMKEKAEWALGIVTGNNSKFISDKPLTGFEPIIRGNDVHHGGISDPSSFIYFDPESFQQTAPEWKYRARPKLVYRFISKQLNFAVDGCGRLTLNSANIIIPGKDLTEAGWDAERIAAFFNSEVCNFIFQKRFNSVKVLRSHLEELPLPSLLTLYPFGLTKNQIAHIKDSL